MPTAGDFPTTTLTLIPPVVLLAALGVMVLLAVWLAHQGTRLFAVLPTLASAAVFLADLAVASLGFHLLWLAFASDQVDEAVGQVPATSNSQALHFAVASVGIVIVAAAFASMLIAWTQGVSSRTRFRWFAAAAGAASAVAIAFLSGYASVTETVVSASDKAAEDLTVAALAALTAVACGGYAATHTPEDPAAKAGSRFGSLFMGHLRDLRKEVPRSATALASRLGHRS